MRPLTPEALAAHVADRVVALDAPVRVAVDAPPWSGLPLADLLAVALADRSRPAQLVRAADFMRPASLRFERGRDDPDAFYEEWIDLAALRREVLEPTGPGGSRRMLPTLWDPVRERATRAAYVELPPHSVVVVDGWFLLGAGLPLDLSVHVSLTAAARQRRVPAADASRELPAWERYEAEVRPTDLADVLVRADDPRRPALVLA